MVLVAVPKLAHPDHIGNQQVRTPQSHRSSTLKEGDPVMNPSGFHPRLAFPVLASVMVCPLLLAFLVWCLLHGDLLISDYATPLLKRPSSSHIRNHGWESAEVILEIMAETQRKS
jgi:hypothetical protein